jgi:hypothetical protein
MAICTFTLAVGFFLIGVVVFFSPESTGQNLQPNPATGTPWKMQTTPPRPSLQTPRMDTVTTGGAAMTGTLQKLDWVRVNDRIQVAHPVKGELSVHVLGRILFTELWQKTSGAQSPWVPTGNLFAGFWLEQEMLLLNWLNRFYLLDERIEVTDTDILRDFAPYAKKFAQSNQTADVYFAYPPASWHIVDIGKFSIAAVEGAVRNHVAGVTGRFIHAGGDSGRALVLDDFESGAQDAVWFGYQIQEEQIRKI